MGKMTTLDGKLLFNDIKVPLVCHGLTPVVNFDAINGNIWASLILSEFSRIKAESERRNRCFFLPHHAELFPEIALDNCSRDVCRMLVHYYNFVLKLGLTATLGNLTGDVLPDAHECLIARRTALYGGLQIIVDLKNRKLDPLSEVAEAIKEINTLQALA